MVPFLIILGSLVLIIFLFLVYRNYADRPKSFKGTLKPLEKSLFQELEHRLPGKTGALIPQQLTYLKRGVRLYFPKSFNLELYEVDSNPLPDELLFERKDEFKLAILSFTHGMTKYKAEFNAYNGRICGITVRPATKNIRGVIIRSFDKFTLANDPMEKLDLHVVTEYYEAEDSFQGLLHDLSQKYSLSHVTKPLPEKQRKLFIRLSETKLPPDYLQLLEQTNGFDINEVRIAGLGALQSVSLEDANYLMLAEKSIGCLSAKQSKKVTQLKFHSYEGETDIKNLGSSFMEALDEFIKMD
jgi:hypothetical protein